MIVHIEELKAHPRIYKEIAERFGLNIDSSVLFPLCWFIKLPEDIEDMWYSDFTEIRVTIRDSIPKELL